MSCESASHHFALFFFEMGSLEGFVILNYPSIIFAARQKTCSKLSLPPPPYDTSVAVVRRHLVAPSSITLHSLALRRPPTALVPCRRPPPLSSRRVVPRPRLSRLRRRSEGTAASPHPSPSRRRRGKIPPVTVVLRSDDDARRPPPPSSRAVQHLLS